MNTTLKASIGLGAIVVLAVLVLLMIRVSPVLGSVQDGSEYSYGTTTAAGLKSFKQATPACTLGSIVIASSSATAFTVKNASSTTDVSSTTIASFEANAAEGTYTFDVSCARGVAVDAPTGFNGYVITTYR